MYRCYRHLKPGDHAWWDTCTVNLDRFVDEDLNDLGLWGLCDHLLVGTGHPSMVAPAMEAIIHRRLQETFGDPEIDYRHDFVIPEDSL